MTTNASPEDSDPYRDQVEEIVSRQESDPVGTFQALKALAPRSVVAELMLGLAYGQGLGTVVDNVAEEECYQRAAQKGSPTALFNLGVCSRARDDYPKALEFYRQAAALGGSEAMEAWEELKEWVDLREANALAQTDSVQAHAAYRVLAEAGSVEGMLRLAWTYGAGFGTEKNPEQEESWYRQALTEGSTDEKGFAAYRLGCIAEGRGDYAKACEMYQCGIDLGYARSHAQMGVIYETGRGVQKDPTKARSYYEEAARLGNLYGLQGLARLDLSGRFGLINFFRGFARMLRASLGLTSASEKWGGRWVVTGSTLNTSLLDPKKKS